MLDEAQTPRTIARDGRFRNLPLAVACIFLGVALKSTLDLGLSAVPPRSRVSAPTPEPTDRPDKWWHDVHDKYVRQVQEADAASGKALGVIFYGDSLTESWNGLDHGFPCPRAAGVDAIFNASFGAYNARAFGIGSDESAHLEWRLEHGEVPSAGPHAPTIVVLNIGTNDLGAAREGTTPVTEQDAVVAAVPALTLRLLRLLRRFRAELPDTHVLLQALYPRARDGGPGMFLQPSVYTAALRSINDHLHAFAAEDGHFHFVDCNDVLRLPDGSLHRELIPDGIHPSPEGYRRLAACLEIPIRKIWDESHRSSSQAASEDADGGDGGEGDGGGSARGVISSAIAKAQEEVAFVSAAISKRAAEIAAAARERGPWALDRDEVKAVEQPRP